ncbi:hypothetical protein [Streptococcus parauberis]|uniref:hypothetical protein n=1 Tax=Streptococcus parauberis TaxID=1348 RepID=UPI000CCEB713|nr:hypothetical protein [Streptococcus parauberis]PNY20393.1 hypothetical protein ASN86_00171 [Streptococcus parauberis]
MKIIDAFIMDNPDLYWLASTSYQVDYSDSDVYVSFKVPKDAKATYEHLQTIGDQILSASPKGDDYQNVQHFYNYIIASLN